MKCDFSYNHYRGVLKKALRMNFVITNFRDYPQVQKSAKIIILRHDIDSFPERDLKIAQIENHLSIKSTFFVRVHGEYYSPFEKNTFKNLQEILKLGHEIGLHFEARLLAPDWKMNRIEVFKREKRVLEEMLGLKIISAAEHAYLGRPENFWKNHFFTQVSKAKVGIKNYPQEKRFQKFHYLSDSLGHWREGCLCKNLPKYNYFQVLFHSAQWGKGGVRAVKKLLNLT